MTAAETKRRRPPHAGSRLLSLILFLLFPILACGNQSDAGAGYVDRLTYYPAERQLLVAGWAAPMQPTVFTNNVVIVVGGHEIYRGRLQRLERPDVVTATGRPDWLWSGWQVQVALPRSIEAGDQAVAVRIRLSNGVEFDLSSAPSARSIRVPPSRNPSTRAVVAFSIAVVLPLIVFLFAERLADAWRVRGRPVAPAPTIFAGSVGLCFLLLVATGLTGSSFRLALEASPLVADDSIHWSGQPRAVRGDEWALITPLAISQLAHDPPLPVVNRNLGADGQNMLVVGMSSVPVAHVSALARPATWGFFLFDLRRALAWHWWFPFFACFAALWLFLRRFFEIDWRMAAALSLTVAAAPYSVVFSGWPAYAVFFPVLGIVAADGLLREQRLFVAILHGVLLGLCIAGFGLVLYPAWLISLAYLLVPFALAAFLSNRHALRLGSAQVAAALCALMLSGSLLASWWLDARDAISAIASTVYPGQRNTEIGGDIDPWFLIKGLMSPITMYGNSSMMDQSDAGSFVFLLLPAAVGVLGHSLVARRLDLRAAVLLGYVAIVLLYVFVGFGITMAKVTLWGSSPPYRQDLGLGLAQVLLFAWLASQAHSMDLTGARWLKPLAVAVAALTAIHAATMFRLLPTPIDSLISPAFAVLSCVALGVAAYLLMVQRYAVFVALYCAWMVGTALPFNPLGQAPTTVEANAAFADLRTAVDKSSLPGRIAIVGEPAWAMTLPAAGTPVANTVFYYPQKSLWETLDPAGAQRALYNRYQRLYFTLAELHSEAAHKIESPRLDEVRVTLDPRRFDFRLLGADGVLTSAADADALAANHSLQTVTRQSGWALLRIVK